MLSSRGRLDPTARVKLVWGVLQSGLAIVLLLSGGLEGLRAATILAAAPFSLIMVAMCVALLAALKGEDRRARILKRREALRQQRLWKMIREKAGGDSPTAEEWHGDG
jgi:glycine betaine transporter